MKLSRSLILLALAALLPLTVLAAALGAVGLRQEQRAMRTDAEARVDLASALVERELQRTISALTVAAQSPLLDGPLDVSTVVGYLGRLKAAEPGWRAVSVVDPSGVRLAAVGGAGFPAPVLDIDSSREALRTGGPAIGRIQRRPDGLSFAIRVPAIRNGKVLYLVSAVLAPSALRQVFLDHPLPSGWLGGVVDASGRVVVRINAPQEAVGGFATPDTLKIRARSATGYVRGVSLEGTPLINAFRVLPASHWSVHAAIPLSVYDAPFVRASWLVGTTVALSLLMAGVFLWLLAREMRLRQRAADAFEEGRRMEALGRMTGGVAHDFNNLLMIVQGSAEMLKRRRDPEQAAGFADAILSAAQRGQSLTRQLLAFARRSVHEPVVFRLQDRATLLGELIRRSVGDKVEVALGVPADLWALHADPDALEIALINLAVNARDVMPDGGALSITAANVTCRRDRQSPIEIEGDFVCIAVADSGGGVPEEHIGHIFEPFYTTKPSGRGTGLGLSQVYGFTRQSGGVVTVANRPGEGAVFTLYLPRAAGEPAVAAVLAAPPAAVPGQARGRLLLVDDDDEVARALEAMLQSGGYTVSRAAAAAAALAMVEGGDFDVVLADMLADRSGRDLAGTLRRIRPHLAVVLMTGHLDGPAEAGAETVLRKPFGPDRVLAALAKARSAAGSAAA